jgi:cytochrome P450
VVGRQALNDYPVDNYTLPAGSTVFMSPYVIHHDPRYFPDPDRFHPERWTPEMKMHLPKFAYFPFGGGPRLCIGEQFARMEGILLIAAIAQRWQMRLMPGHRVSLQPRITLRPKYGMVMIPARRKVGM